MKKAVIILSGFSAVLMLFLVTIVVQDFIKLPKQIFQRSIYSIVEVKSTTNEFESFGTAVVINNQEELITNYHVVSYIQNNEKYIHEVILIRLAMQEEYTKMEVN